MINASNVLGVVEGTDKKDEYVFITAHYDHVGIINGQIHNGADDDGSGTVAIMQIGEAFVKAKAEAAREMALASGIEYKMFAGSLIMKTNVLKEEHQGILV